MPTARPLGNIITFYSYKGGTGRTMALANTACVLAERVAIDENVLVVDWDLEAPGLHQFLPARLRNRGAMLDTGLGAEPGLIDLFVALRDALHDAEPTSEDAAHAAASEALSQLHIERFIGDTEVPNIHIVRAGRNDDGGYSKRVNTFDWEGLFRRAPGLYRQVAEHLAERYRYVLIDSRTGVTDISGICTSLLPEKLVVVFTPNRQSLTGVRELVSRATAYRLGSDDLRPLLVYPLPSRIEVSMEKLNAHWRHGHPDAGIPGYQPMFQSLLKECYALPSCDLTDYFNDVQIQQSADCAYGEVISVRQTSSERLSLASSYRVFVDQLLDPTPPWVAHAPAAAAQAPPLPEPTTQSAPNPLPLPAQTSPRQTPASTAVPTPASRSAPGMPRDGKKVFLSYARADSLHVSAVAAALKEHGYSVWIDLDIQPGVAFQQAITAALDASDAVIVFWSAASVASDYVKAEAGEGSRRGILLPVLLDDAFPPLEFRRYQAVDLRYLGESGMARLLEDVARIVERRPAVEDGFTSAARASAPEPLSPAARPRRSRVALWGVAGVLALGAIVVFSGVMNQSAAPPSHPTVDPTTYPSPNHTNPPPAPTQAVPSHLLTVPDFTGRTTDDVQKVADVLGLTLLMTDEKHSVEQRYLDGVVVGQKPAAGTQASPQATVTLTVATQTATVPSVVGMSLGKALDILQQSGLTLGRSDSVTATGAPSGSVVRQTPTAGTAVPAGTKVDVGVAASPPPSQQRNTNGASRRSSYPETPVLR